MNIPNSRKALDKNRHKGQFSRDNAVEMAEKSHKARAINRSLNADLREQCTPELMAELNQRVISMARHGNLKAYELVRDGLGEKPTDKHEVSVADDSLRMMDEYFKRTGDAPAEE